MDCFVGAQTGAFKLVDFKHAKANNVNRIANLVPKENGITAMCFGDEQQSQIVAVQSNRGVKLYDTLSETYIDLFVVEGGSGPVQAVSLLDDGNLITAVESGDVRIWKPNGESILGDETWNVGSNLLCFAKKPSESIVATGGKENILKLWDVEKRTSVFEAKNVKNDFLDHRVPVWETNVRFLNENEIVTTTGKSEIRIYDPRVQKRPVQQGKYMDTPITAMSLCNRTRHIVVGNTTGNMSIIDLRKGVKPYYKFRGFSGAIKSIDAHPIEPYVVSCGIDRYIRLHNIDTKKLVQKIFAKVRLSCILLKDENNCHLAATATKAQSK